MGNEKKVPAIFCAPGGLNLSRYQVECADCSAHTVFVEYSNEKEKLEAEQTVATLWNIGKVVRSDVGE